MRDLIDRIRTDFSLLDRKAIFALVYTAFGLTAIFYLKDQVYVADVLAGSGFAWVGDLITDQRSSNLPALAWWGVVVTVFYFVIPAIWICVVKRERLADYGLQFRIEPGFAKVFATVMAIMLPLVYLMSLTDSFTSKYPFLKIYDGEPYFGTTLLIWELIYFVQFFGLEFFFRGFLVHSLRPALGIYSIFAMTVPYCMIHFGKPPAETLSAIAAGIFLGWLSFRNGNIWMGLVLHCSVAFSMDVLALYNKGQLF
ncbi:MAG TPA: CPBP family intramembrane glutamic endopeptidase [Pyrinomonadaceae bacterium]|nr:CPBP family intramembrane glutamic endopeptidase [Pyrinomonadaceae bacterium]